MTLIALSTVKSVCIGLCEVYVREETFPENDVAHSDRSISLRMLKTLQWHKYIAIGYANRSWGVLMANDDISQRFVSKIVIFDQKVLKIH